jgi:hypothetical protein
MKYHSEFPRDARARVEAETLRAYRLLGKDVRGVEAWRREGQFIRCVMRVFLGFAREACEFGKDSGRRAWSDRELDQRCREFLLMIVVDAWEEKGKDLGIRKPFSSPHNWGYSLDDDARRNIEKSPEWEQYQELLLEAFEAQSARAPAQLPPMPSVKTQTLHDEEVPRRGKPKDFVDIAKRALTRSYEKLAAHIGISKDTLYAITKETRWVSDDNYILVAGVCGCKPEDLHPRDVPRPKHRGL